MAGPFHWILISPTDLAAPTRSTAGPNRGGGPQLSFSTDEAAARHYLSQALGSGENTEPLRGLAPSAASQPVPDLVLKSAQELPTETVALKFVQNRRNIQVFGAQAVVEIKPEDRSLVKMDLNLAEPPDRDRYVPRLSQEEALGRIAGFAGAVAADLARDLPPATLTFYHDIATGVWHLAYFFRRVPASPPDPPGEAGGLEGGHGLAPRPGPEEYDYLVDAEDGAVLFYYSSNPTLTTAKLADVLGAPRVVYVEKQEAGLELHDTLRKLKTYDLRLQDYTAPLPAAPVLAPAKKLPPAAVSAHANAAHVLDFYRSVLTRQGVDDKGMYVISVVNVTDSARQPPPEWRNAVWYKDKMWYGQNKDGDGNLQSYARFLDVIAHELTHGVTQFTADLVYKNQSGALNESFSDIFGVLINNWSPVGGFNPLDKFDWKIGPGLGKDGKPLRDLEKPATTGDPDHMNNYNPTPADSGGVHTNSNIHNKAFHFLLTTSDAAGYVFDPRDVAVMYYLCLTRLPRTADFGRVRKTLIDVAEMYFAAETDEVRQARVKAVADAYDNVGIK